MTRLLTGVFVVLLVATALVVRTAGQAQGNGSDHASWSPKAAAAYLDGRAVWWSTWKNSARDQGTFCVSCHTAMPYALARSSLRTALAERESTAAERLLFDNVSKRVTLWKDLAPLYPDQSSGLPKSSESRGTESILNALILASRDAPSGRLAADTRSALANMWALQMRTGPLNGAWAWLNFKYEPWESTDAAYMGASLAAIAIGTAPEGYAASADIQENVKRLRGYIQKEFGNQPAHNRLMALWASSRLADLLTPEQRKVSIDAVLAAQQADGGWSTASLGTFKRIDGTAIDTASDGYATGLVTLVLQQAGVSGEARVGKGLDWLKRHQDPATGQWIASSLNKQRDPASDPGKFMSDAATAYAAMSLSLAK